MYIEERTGVGVGTRQSCRERANGMTIWGNLGPALFPLAIRYKVGHLSGSNWPLEFSGCL